MKFDDAISEGFDKFFKENKDARISISIGDARKIRDIAYQLLGTRSMLGATPEEKENLLKAATIATHMDMELRPYEPRTVKPDERVEDEDEMGETQYGSAQMGPGMKEQEFDTTTSGDLERTLQGVTRNPEIMKMDQEIAKHGQALKNAQNQKMDVVKRVIDSQVFGGESKWT